jgi:hypothetical protein
MSESDGAALRTNVDKVMAELRGKLIEAAGPNPRTGKANLAKLIDDKLGELSKELVKAAAGPNPRT